MGLYERFILPRILHLAMQNKDVAEQRRSILPAARGHVLEIGIGSGLNLPFYPGAIDSLTGVDPSAALLAMARKSAGALPFPVAFVERGAEDLPFDDRRFDTVVTTWTLCSIPQAAQALGEMHRVLRPDGELIFIEHGHAPDARVAAWQDRINPIWKRVAGGCNLNRRIDALIGAAGFDISHLEAGYLIQGPRLLTYQFKGRARRG